MVNQSGVQQPLGQGIQDLFLNGARCNQLVVTIKLMDGTCVDAMIKNFDRFSIVVDQSGCDRLISKDTIAMIRPSNAMRVAAQTT